MFLGILCRCFVSEIEYFYGFPLLFADSHLGFLPTEWSEEKGRVVPLSPLLLSLLDDVRQGLGGPGAQLVENVLEALLLLQPNR